MTNIKIEPRNDHILVKRDEEQSRITDTGLSMPDNVEQEQKAFGTVVAVGPDISDVKKGDRVVYAAFAGEEIEVTEKDGEKVAYRLLKDEYVIAFIRSNKK